MFMLNSTPLQFYTSDSDAVVSKVIWMINVPPTTPESSSSFSVIYMQSLDLYTGQQMLMRLKRKLLISHQTEEAIHLRWAYQASRYQLSRIILLDLWKLHSTNKQTKNTISWQNLCFLQLALTGAPKYSSIYVFTDAQAKDIYLKDTVIALMRTTKSTVNIIRYLQNHCHQAYCLPPLPPGPCPFDSIYLSTLGTRKYNLSVYTFLQVSFFLTNIFSRRRRSLSIGSLQDYKDMALASGGQVIQVSKGQLPQATDIILDTSTSALVGLFFFIF